MNDDIYLKNGMVIPSNELEITASRGGGPGGQHVNKTSTRITVRWNVPLSQALSADLKQRIMQKLQSELTNDGDLIVHNVESRSQQHNKEMALLLLGKKIDAALHVPKKRMKSKIPRSVKESRLQEKKQRGNIKKMRRDRFDE